MSSRRIGLPGHIVLAFALAILPSCQDMQEQLVQANDKAGNKSCKSVSQKPVPIPAGSFVMGSEAVYAEEGPRITVEVASFWIDTTEVTNRQFREFVENTGYLTVAEKPVDAAVFQVPREEIPPELLQPGSAVFTPPLRPSNRYSDWWTYVPGASWRYPHGPEGSPARADEPVVHLAYEDMSAFAEWKGGRLPTEAEWEYAARAGEPKYTAQPASSRANTWQGVFPMNNAAADGFEHIAPVGCYQANSFGLYDMVGNVWEVTSDIYSPGHEPSTEQVGNVPGGRNPTPPVDNDRRARVMKGGSYLCAPNYCMRYRPESRQGRDPGMGTSNVGFRLAYDSDPSEN